MTRFAAFGDNIVTMQKANQKKFRPALSACYVTAAVVFLGALSRAAEAPSNLSWATLPKVKAQKFVYYPDNAKRVGLEGKVLLAFNIANDGRVTNVAEVDSDDPVLSKTATEYLKGLLFEVPQARGAAVAFQERYRMGFVFCLPPSSLDDKFAVPVFPVWISGSRIKGSPIRNPPLPGATGKCAR